MAPRQEELSCLMVGLAGPGTAEWVLLIIIQSPPISWNKVKLALVNPVKFVAQMLQLMPSISWGPSPALHVKCTSAGGNPEPGPWLRLAAALRSPE